MPPSWFVTLAQAAAPPGGSPSPDASEPGKSLLEHILSGGPVGYIILGLSFAAASLVIVHTIQIRLARLAPPELFDELRAALSRRDLTATAKICNNPDNACFLTRVIGSAVSRAASSPFGTLELRNAVEEAGQEEVARLYRSTDGLSLIAAVAPMLGLFGTVVGIVGAFDELGSASGGFARPDQLASSISVALITTALGLALAIPATAFLTLFRNRIDAVAARVARLTEELLLSVETATAQQQPARAQRPQQAAQPTRQPTQPPAQAPTQARPAQPTTQTAAQAPQARPAQPKP